MNFRRNQNLKLNSIFLFSSKQAEALIEVLISISIIALLSSVSINLLITGTQNIAENRAMLQATLLMEEGIDYFVNLFNSNKKKFSFDVENCWYQKPNVTECEENDKLLSGNYILTNQLYGNEPLKYLSSPLNLNNNNNNNEEYRLYAYDLNTNVDTNGDGSSDNDIDFYGNFKVSEGSNIKQLDQSPFYREIKLKIQEIKMGNLIVKKALIKSRVLWVHGNSVKEISNIAIW